MDTWAALSAFHSRSFATAGNRDSLLERELVREFLNQVPIPNVFGCLQEASNNGAEKEVKLICQCLERIFRSNGGSEILFQDEMIQFLIAGVGHDQLPARKLTLEMIDIHLTEQYHSKMGNDALLQAIAESLLDQDPGIARTASDILLKLTAATENGIYHKILPNLRAILSEYLSRPSRENSTEFVRLLELITKCAGASEAVMEEAVALGLIQPILDGINSTDVLFQLNLLDIIPNICATKRGLSYVFRSDDVDVLRQLIQLSRDPLVGGNALRLIGKFSNLAATHGIESWNWTDATLSKAFLGAVETAIESNGDPPLQMAAMDAISTFASSSDKELSLLLAHRSLCDTWLSLGKSTLLEVKSSCFCSVASILACRTRLNTSSVPEENATLWSYNQQLFKALGAACGRPTTMSHLMDCLRQPFEPIRVGVYTLLQAVAVQGNPWGIETLQAYGGFIEYLVDRTTEPTKTTREWKFAIIDALLASKFQNVLGARSLEDLQKFFEQGPYAGKAKQAEMMLESM